MQQNQQNTNNEELLFRSINHAAKNAQQVVVLDLSGQKRDKLPVNLSVFEHLEILNLSDNQFAKLPEGISKLSKLKNLDISDTSIRDITPLHKLDSLKTIKCLNTKLTLEKINDFKKNKPNVLIESNAKPKKQVSTKTKLISVFMILLIIAISYAIMLIITPTSQTASLFLLGFIVFVIATVGVALLIRQIGLLLKK